MDFFLKISFRLMVSFRRALRWCLGKRGPIVKWDNLTLEHLQQSPIWLISHEHDFGHWLFELEDEESLRPWDGEYPAPPNFIGLVHTKFTAANGTMFSGVVGHSEYEAEDTPLIWRLSPELFLNDGERIPLQAGWNRQRDETALKDACERFYAATGLNSDTAFPMKYEVSAEILQEPISGSFPGLYFRTEDGEIEYVT